MEKIIIIIIITMIITIIMIIMKKLYVIFTLKSDSTMKPNKMCRPFDQSSGGHFKV